jgi:hypothetical protein
VERNTGRAQLRCRCTQATTRVSEPVPLCE